MKNFILFICYALLFASCSLQKDHTSKKAFSKRRYRKGIYMHKAKSIRAARRKCKAYKVADIASKTRTSTKVTPLKKLSASNIAESLETELKPIGQKNRILTSIRHVAERRERRLVEEPKLVGPTSDSTVSGRATYLLYEHKKTLVKHERNKNIASAIIVNLVIYAPLGIYVLIMGGSLLALVPFGILTVALLAAIARKITLKVRAKRERDQLLDKLDRKQAEDLIDFEHEVKKNRFWRVIGWTFLVTFCLVLLISLLATLF